MLQRSSGERFLQLLQELDRPEAGQGRAEQRPPTRASRSSEGRQSARQPSGFGRRRRLRGLGCLGQRVSSPKTKGGTSPSKFVKLLTFHYCLS